jgi:hypothetical protein
MLFHFVVFGSSFALNLFRFGAFSYFGGFQIKVWPSFASLGWIVILSLFRLNDKALKRLLQTGAKAPTTNDVK